MLVHNLRRELKEKLDQLWSEGKIDSKINFVEEAILEKIIKFNYRNDPEPLESLLKKDRHYLNYRSKGLCHSQCEFVMNQKFLFDSYVQDYNEEFGSIDQPAIEKYERDLQIVFEKSGMFEGWSHEDTMEFVTYCYH